ncbi:MAG: hypothetical protein MJH10_10325 [Epibacterium sp.]|nr:hypothetical protein [Epibacterium sp.]NQX73935.1 hypothetical protein [Epibacterium sp.]
MENGLASAHAQYVQWYESAEDQTRVARELSERCWDYYDGKQLTDAELAALKARNQPPVVKNWIKREVDTLVGLEKGQRTDPKAYPRTPQHEQGAQACTDALRYVVENEDYDQKRSLAWFDMVVKGYGGLQLVLRPNMRTGENDIGLENTPWDRMWFDPHSSKPDFEDARYLGLVVWHDMDVAQQIYANDPGAIEALEANKSNSQHETYDDKPRTRWYDTKRNRVRVVQMYHRTERGWMFCEFTKGGKLREGASPWLDEYGRPTHPFIWRSAYVSRDNDRYGVVKELLDIQDEINKRSSKLLHFANVRQSWSNGEVIPDETQFRSQLSQPDGHLTANGELGRDWGIIDNQADVAGHANLLQEAKQEMNLAGPNPSLSGEQQSARSGRALQAEQQASLMQLGGLLDALRDVDKRVFRKIWLGVRQYWTGPKWIRVTDDERNMKFVGLNVPAQDPVTGQVVVQNPVDEMDVDIIVEDAPDVVSLEGETFANLVELGRVGVQIPPMVYVRAAPGLRDRKQLLDMMEQMQANPAQEQAQQLAMAKEQSEIEYTQARTMKERSQALENMTDAAAARAKLQAGIVS